MKIVIWITVFQQYYSHGVLTSCTSPLTMTPAVEVNRVIIYIDGKLQSGKVIALEAFHFDIINGEIYIIKDH